MESFPIDLQREQIEGFCHKCHIEYFALFGSILTPQFNEKSDVDVLVKFPLKHVLRLFGIAAMECELSEIIGGTVDLRTPQDLIRDIIDPERALVLNFLPSRGK